MCRYYVGLPYIDEKRVGIWGWVSWRFLSLARFVADRVLKTQSYGGYLTSKVIETNSSVFTLGMAVAPVTDWRYYDTICEFFLVAVERWLMISALQIPNATCRLLRRTSMGTRRAL